MFRGHDAQDNVSPGQSVSQVGGGLDVFGQFAPRQEDVIFPAALRAFGQVFFKDPEPDPFRSR